MGVRPFQFVDFEAQAAEIVDRARAEADAIRERARQEGIAEGREIGIREERERLADLIQELVLEVGARRENLIRESERDLVRLAVAIAEKVIKAEIKAKRPVAEANLRAAAALAAGRQGLVARLNPVDLKALDVEQIGPLTLRGDPSIERGGCVVDLSPGEIDLRIKTQLDQIEKGLLE